MSLNIVMINRTILIKGKLSFAVVDATLPKRKIVVLSGWPIVHRADHESVKLYQYHGAIPQKMVSIQIYSESPIEKVAKVDIVKPKGAETSVLVQGTKDTTKSPPMVLRSFEGYVKAFVKKNKFGTPLVKLFLHREEDEHVKRCYSDKRCEVFEGEYIATYIIARDSNIMVDIIKMLMYYSIPMAYCDNGDTRGAPRLTNLLIVRASRVEQLTQALSSVGHVKVKQYPPLPYNVLL